MSKLFKMMGVTAKGAEPFVKNAAGLAMCLLVTMILAGVMMACYRICHTSLTYNKKFNVTLMMLSLSSTLLLALIQNNPMFSLGALGALSICRIRINTRDPRDLGFVFWSLMIGISSALGAFTVGLMGTAFIFAVMIVANCLEHKQKSVTMVVRGEKEKIGKVRKLFSEVKGGIIQSENVFSDSFEIVYELDIPKDEENKLMQKLNDLEGISGINILAPQTEVA